MTSAERWGEATVIPDGAAKTFVLATRLRAFLPVSWEKPTRMAMAKGDGFTRLLMQQHRNKTLVQSARRMTTAEAGQASRNSIEP